MKTIRYKRNKIKRIVNKTKRKRRKKTKKTKRLKGILSTNKFPLVSKDFNHNSSSSIFDLTQTQVVNDNFCRILSWYDNEWGFSNRMLDTARQIGQIT